MTYHNQGGQTRRVSPQPAQSRHALSRTGGGDGGKRNPLYRSSYALLANTAGTTVVGVVYWAVAAHLYDRQSLGRSSALIAALTLVSGFAQLNLVNTLPRFVPKAGRSTGALVACSYGASSLAAAVGGLLFVVVMPRLSSHWQFLGNSLYLECAFVIAVVAWGVFALQDVVLLSLHHPAVVPVENFGYGIGKLIILAGVAWIVPATGIFVSWIVPLAITLPAVNWLIFRHYLSEYYATAAQGSLRASEVTRFASVDYLGSILSQSYGNLLPLLVLSVLGAAANSSFYVAWTIAAGLGLVGTNFGMSMLVEGAATPGRIAELTRGVVARSLAITSLGACLIFVAARPILKIYGSGYVVSTMSLLRLLIIGTIPGCLILIAISLDRIAGRVGRATVTRLTLTVLVLGGSWLLAKKLGTSGVALAWGGANLVVALMRLPTIVKAARRTVPESSASIRAAGPREARSELLPRIRRGHRRISYRGRHAYRET